MDNQHLSTQHEELKQQLATLRESSLALQSANNKLADQELQLKLQVAQLAEQKAQHVAAEQELQRAIAQAQSDNHGLAEAERELKHQTTA